MSTALSCPACQHDITHAVDAVDLRLLAEAWSANWPRVPAPTTSELTEWIRSDLQSDTIGFRRCDRCALEFAQPMRTWTAGHYPSQSHGLGFDHAEALDVLRCKSSQTVLEIGCGCGEFLKAAAGLGHACLGIDFSRDSVARAREIGMHAEVMDLKALAAWPDRPSTFDVVAMFQVIEHLEHPDQLFEDLSELVGPQATLLIGCPSPDRHTRWFSHAQRIGQAEFWDYPPQHVLRWNAQAMTAFLNRHGWRVEAIRNEPFRVVNAAAELVAIDGQAAGWYRNPFRRRLATLLRRIQLTIFSLGRRYTGTRLFVQATREGH